MKINWTKHKIVVKTKDDQFILDERSRLSTAQLEAGYTQSYYEGPIYIKCEDQDISSISATDMTYLIGRLTNVKFLDFKIAQNDDETLYKMAYVSPISLTDYDVLDMHLGVCGTFNTLEECKIEAERLVNNFIENFGK